MIVRNAMKMFPDRGVPEIFSLDDASLRTMCPMGRSVPRRCVSTLDRKQAGDNHYSYRARICNVYGAQESIPHHRFRQARICNVYGAQESIPHHRFRQPCGPVRQVGCHTGPPGWESIHGLLKRFTNTGSVLIQGTYHPRINVREHIGRGRIEIAPLFNTVIQGVTKSCRLPWLTNRQ